MTNPRQPHTNIENSVTRSAPPMFGLRASPVQRALMYQPIIAPTMKTSPCAKLMSFSTP